MKMFLDYLPIAAFAATYFATDIYTATGVLMAATVLLVIGYYIATREIHKMHLATAILAVIFGGLTIAVHDPLFIKIKPTVLYALFALVLLGSGFIGDKPIIQRALQSQLTLPAPVWRRLNLMWVGFFLLCGVLNLYVAFVFSSAVWVNFKLFGMLGLTLVFVLLQGLYLSQHISEES